ncbi:MAG TPA: DUF6705 family protein [Flavobacteriaceae bacterium]|nr:DUF6705 family protein [Flavobacteriaceae bacterium]
MKKQLIIVMGMLVCLSCKAQNPPLQQIIPLEDYINYQNNDIPIPDNVYFKDINGLLDKYVGTWIGTYNNKTFEFHVVKTTPQSDIRPSVTIEQLYMRYKITDANGNVIENTLNLPDTSPMVIKGSYISRDLTDYFLYYVGQESGCGQHGDIVIFEISTTQMELYFRPGENVYTSNRCPNGPAQQVLPVETALVLTKQ